MAVPVRLRDRQGDPGHEFEQLEHALVRVPAEEEMTGRELAKQAGGNRRTFSMGWGRVKKDADGNRVCRWCDAPVPKGRRSWCSEGCVDEYLMLSRPEYAARKVFARDKGVCAKCGLDTEQMRHLYRHPCRLPDFDAVKAAATLGLSCVYLPNSWQYAPEINECARAYGIFASRSHDECLQELGYLFEWIERSGFDRFRQRWWDMDHVVEVVNGGGLCGLDNLQTLCIPCHKAKTKRLAQDRAMARRTAKQPELI